MADMMPMAAPMGGGPVFDPNEQRWQDTVTTREPTHSRTTGQESGQLAPQTLAATEETIAAQQNLAQTRAQAMPAAQAMDAAALAKAQAQQADAAATITAQQAAASKYEAQLQTAMAEMKARGAAYAEAAKPEVQSFGSRIAAAIGMALGAYAATRAGTPNYAAQIVQMMQTKAEKEHEQRVAAALRLYERSGAQPAQILAARKAAMDEIQAGKVARANEIEAQYQAAISKNPQHAQKLAEELAEKKLAEDKDRRNFLAQHLAQTTRESNTNEGSVRTTASVQGSPTGGNGKPTEFEGKRFEASAGLGKEIETLKQNSGDVSQTMAQMQDNLTKLEGDQETARKGGWSARGVSAGREFLGFPRSAYSGMSEKGQVVAQAVDASNEFVARAMSGAAIGGGFTQGEEARMRRAFSFTPDMSPALVSATIGRLERLREVYDRQAGKLANGDAQAAKELKAEMLSLAGGGSAPRPQEPQKPQAAKAGGGQAQRPGSGIPPQVFKRIQEANRVKKGDPDYAEAQKYVREMAAKYGR